MKTKFFILFMLSFLFFSTAGFCVEENDDQKGVQSVSTAVQPLQIVCSPELSDLATNWLAGFGNLHPEQKIILSSQAEDSSLKEEYLYLLAGNNQKLSGDETIWKMIIGHDLVVSVINPKNPLLNEINKKGLTSEDFTKLITGNSDWSMVINGVVKTPVKSYITDNQQVISKVAGFTKTDQSLISAIKVATAAELISLVQQNINAVGFCNLTDVIDQDQNTFTDQISILPVDKNRNGRMDSFEKIYADPAALTRGAWIGKYPRELSGDIFALSTAKPTNQAAIDFMAYVTGDGQDFIKKSGYSILSSTEKTANMLLLGKSVPPSDDGTKASMLSLTSILLIIAFVLAVLLIVLYGFSVNKQTMIDSDDIVITAVLNPNSIAAPRGLYYDKTHTWAFMEQDGMVKIGIDDFLKHVTGPINQIKMKSPGEKVRKGEKILTIIRDGKQLNLYSPVSGFIRKQNESLLVNPSKINTTSFTDGWVYQLEPGNWLRETSFMFMFDKYKDWLEDEFARLKDFMAGSANSNTVVYQHIVLQDGGELKDNVLADLGPEVWEDFQTKFIDTSR